MPDSHTYHLTRNCLKSGRMFLSPSARALFPKGGTLEALDTLSGHTFTLTLSGPLTVEGLGPFYDRHSLSPNDLVVVANEVVHERRDLDCYLDVVGLEGAERERIARMAPAVLEADIGWYVARKT